MANTGDNNKVGLYMSTEKRCTVTHKELEDVAMLSAVVWLDIQLRSIVHGLHTKHEKKLIWHHFICITRNKMEAFYEQSDCRK